jgi:hypothetical protein
MLNAPCFAKASVDLRRFDKASVRSVAAGVFIEASDRVCSQNPNCQDAVRLSKNNHRPGNR